MNEGHSKRASATKSGPGRYAQHGKPGAKLAKSRPVRAYKALMDAAAQKRVTKAPLRDEHGAITLIGSQVELENIHPTSREVILSSGVDGDEFFYTVRRKWLGGISAQRGF